MFDDPHSGRESKGVWLWAVFSTVTLFLLEFVLFAALIPSAWSERAIATERQWLIDAQGETSAAAVIERGRRWYAAAFVKTDIEPWSYRLVRLGPDDEPGVGMEKLGDYPIWDWLAGRLDVIWDSVRQALVRLSLLLAWTPFFGLTALVAIGDGLLRRRIRQHSFAYASPLAHRWAASGFLWMWLAVFFVLFLPIPLPTASVPAVGVLSALALGVMATNAQKRL
jgi:hypothetical protein